MKQLVKNIIQNVNNIIDSNIKEFIRADLSNPDYFNLIEESYDYVIHLAAFTRVVDSISNPEKLATLKPVLEGGTVTYGGQTYQTDGSACMVVTTPDKADELSRDKKITIKIRGFGMARAENGYMPEAPVPAAQRALASAGLSFDDLDAVKTHNPFAVNDAYFIKQTGYDSKKMNNYGCTLIWGHPQGPMGVRGIIELIEELVILGGGIGLFTGCAAGDTGMSVVIEVGDK